MAEPPCALNIGRDPSCDIRFDPDLDRMVGRIHARVEVRSDGGVYVIDERARNGTFVNGARLTGELRLQLGDKILLGDSGPLIEVLAASTTPKGSTAIPVGGATLVFPKAVAEGATIIEPAGQKTLLLSAQQPEHAAPLSTQQTLSSWMPPKVGSDVSPSVPAEAKTLPPTAAFSFRPSNITSYIDNDEPDAERPAVEPCALPEPERWERRQLALQLALLLGVLFLACGLGGYLGWSSDSAAATDSPGKR